MMQHLNPEVTQPLEQREIIRQKLEKQYVQVVDALNVTRVLEFIPELGKQGIRDERGNIFELPTFETIWKLMENNWQIVQEKWSQGFQQLQLTPIALRIPYLLHRVEQNLSMHAAAQKLFLADEGDPLQPTRWNRIENDLSTFEDDSPPSSKLSYFPDASMNSWTKNKVIAKTQKSAAPGWSICLIQSSPFLDRATSMGDRPPLPMDKTTRQYLQLLNDDHRYAHESGYTLEDALTRFLIRLHATSQVSYELHLHDVLLCAGTCFRLPQADFIPIVYWEREPYTLVLDEIYANQNVSTVGCRTAVRLNWLPEE